MSSFCKCKSYSHFSAKILAYYAIFNDQSFNDMLTNNIISFEQLGPGIYLSYFSTKTYMWALIKSTCLRCFSNEYRQQILLWRSKKNIKTCWLIKKKKILKTTTKPPLAGAVIWLLWICTAFEVVWPVSTWQRWLEAYYGKTRCLPGEQWGLRRILHLCAIWHGIHFLWLNMRKTPLLHV